MKDIVRGIKLALRNMLWQTVYTVSILILSFIPLVGWITPLLALIVECYYLGFSMLDYSCERNKLSTITKHQFYRQAQGVSHWQRNCFLPDAFYTCFGLAVCTKLCGNCCNHQFTQSQVRRHGTRSGQDQFIIMNSVIYLIPTVLEESSTQTIPPYVIEAVKNCQVIFAENERTARRFLKKMDRDIVIDDFEWFTIHKAEAELIHSFKQKINAGKNIAIISEAGCPGIADPGQILIAAAQEMNATVKPLVGPSSILLALMASGMNGQQFEFVGYLPIDNLERNKAISALETASQKKNSTQIFIETPYRNNQLLETLLKTCKPSTKLCIAAELTGPNEFIKTKPLLNGKRKNRLS